MLPFHCYRSCYRSTATVPLPIPPACRALADSADNGGPGGQDGKSPRPSRFDATIIERNHPYRGQKHEIYEGGVRVAGFVYSPLLPATVRGTSHAALLHVVDWLPTLVTASGVASLTSRPHQPLDGVDQWACLLGDGSRCVRDEVVLNINTVCDGPSGGIRTECPAPKLAVRVGELKLLAECYDAAAHVLTGRLELYNLTADPSEQHERSAALPDATLRLAARLLPYAKEAAMVPPLEDGPPWQGAGYYCAKCTVGRPVGHGLAASWEPWCAGAAGVVC